MMRRSSKGDEEIELDSAGVHRRIAELLETIRAQQSQSVVSGKDRDFQREQLTARKKHLFEVCSREAELFCNQSQFKDAIPAASLALKLARELEQEDSFPPCFLLMANAHLGLGQIRQAESCLAQASWVIAKNPECDTWLRARLYRSIGRLYLYKDKPSHALKQLAEDVYFASLAFSPQDIHTSGGYFYMSVAFMQANQVSPASALREKVVDIWRTYLIHFMEVSKGSFEGEGLDPVMESEAHNYLGTILVDFESRFGIYHLSVGKLYVSLALLNHFGNNQHSSSEFLGKAASVVEKLGLSKENPFRAQVEQVAQYIATNGQ